MPLLHALKAIDSANSTRTEHLDQFGHVPCCDPQGFAA